MKLIFCPICHDVFRLISKKRSCCCKQSWGKYIDTLNAEIGGSSIPLGFNNPSFIRAIKNQPKDGEGGRFDAFVIPKTCNTVIIK